jgi:peptidoglycan/LPS O-acetylase OafA/YrhL
VSQEATLSVSLAPPQAATSSRHRMQFLDAIRGLAALAVVFEHACEHFFPGYLVWGNTHFTFGVFGVAEFFLVSGFIIPVSLERHRALDKFWLARAFRLYPLYWASILGVLLFAAMGSMGLPRMIHTQPEKLILANVAMVQLFFNVPNIVGVSWTLSMELVFYLLSSLLFLIGGIARAALWAWIAVLGNLALNVSFALAFHRSVPAGRVGLLVTAFFAALVYRYFSGSISARTILAIFPFLVVSLLTGFWLRFMVYPTSLREDRFAFGGVSSAYLGAYALFFLFYSLRSRQFPKAAIWLGQISYSLYLVHGFVLAIIPAGTFPWLRLAAVLILAIGLSAITFTYIEKPGLALHRWITRRAWSAQTSSRAAESVG